MKIPVKYAIGVVLLGTGQLASGSLVAHWTMDESSGTLSDISGNGLTATPSATGLTYGQSSVGAGTYGAITISPQAAANFGNAIAFSRADSGSFSLAASPLIGGLAEAGPAGSFTLTAWVNHNIGSSSNHRIFSTGLPNGWGVGVSNVDQVLFTAFNVADLRSGNAPLTNNVWQHLAYTWEDGAVEVFLNGNSVFTGTSGFNDETVTSFTIGANANGSDHFNGLIDDLKIYDTVLNRDQIILAAQPIPEPNSILMLGLAGGLFLRRRR